MTKIYSGKFNRQELIVEHNQVVQVEPLSVGLVIARCKGDICNLKVNVSKGVGVHFITSEINRALQITAEVESNSQFTVTLLGKLKQHYKYELQVSIKLIGTNSQVNLQAPLIMSKQSQTDLNFTIQHLNAHSRGRIVARRVQKDSSFSNLLGKLLISENGKNTDAYLSDKTVLLGNLAKAVSRPELEILTNDVKASHGATIGQLSAEEIFYLRSRGLTKNKSEKLLLSAFLNPALIGVPLDISTEFLYEI